MSVPCPNKRCVKGMVQDFNGAWWKCHTCGGRGVVPDPEPAGELEGGDRAVA